MLPAILPPAPPLSNTAPPQPGDYFNRLLEACKCPSLVKLASIETHEIDIGGVSFIAYSEQLLEGVPLSDLIGSKHIPSEYEIRTLLICLVEAITELSEDHKCIHRDIKPGNIIKLNNGNPPFVVLDLGVTFDAEGTRLTDPGLSPGTPIYRAPEMLEIDYADKLDARTDLYCAGVTAFEYATGVHPLGPWLTGTVESRILHSPPQRLKNLRADLSDDLCDLIDRLNRKKPPLRGNLPLIRKDLGITL